MTMGAYLRAARRRRRIGMDRAAEETRIRSDFLMRMESDEFDFLAPTYVRGFLKTYARYLRVDPTPLLEEFDSRFGARRMESQQILALERHGKKHSSLPRKRMNSWTVAAMMALSVIVVLALIGLTQDSGDDDGSTPVATTDTDLPSASPSPSTPSVTTTPTEGSVAAVDGVTVEVVAVNGDCWVLAAEDGTEVDPGGETLNQGDTFTFTGEETVFLRLGAPWAVELIVNGQNIGSPGGQDPVNLTFPDDLNAL
jgi:cytoskeleton protein RodZ